MKKIFLVILIMLVLATGLVYARTTTTDLELIKPTWAEETDILVDLNANSDILEAFANDPLEFYSVVDGDIPDDITIDLATLATLATTLTVSDNESTNETNAILFTSGGDLDGGDLGIECDGDLYYNPSTGALTAKMHRVYMVSETTALNAAWLQISSTVVTGDLTGVRTIMTSDAASGGDAVTGVNVRGAYGQAVCTAGKHAGLLQGGLFTATAGAASEVYNVHVLCGHYSAAGAAEIDGDLYVGYLRAQSRGTGRTVTGHDVLLALENEAVQGTGQIMDSAIRIFDTNMGVDGFTYGIDMTDADITTADIRLQYGETISNATDARVTVGGGDLNIDTGKKYLINGTQITSNALSDVASIAMLDEAETITGNWVNTDNPWADNEVSDDITITIADTTDSTSFPLLAETITGAQKVKSDAGLTYDASTGDLKATKHGGITEANLLDKSASESITGNWDSTGTFDIANNNTAAGGDDGFQSHIIQTTSALTGTLRGAYITASMNQTGASSGTIRGLEVKARAESVGGSGGTVAVLEGISISADSKDQSVTTMRGIEVMLDGSTGGTVTEGVGIRIANNMQADKTTTMTALQIYSDSFPYDYGIDLSQGGGGMDVDIKLSGGAEISTTTGTGDLVFATAPTLTKLDLESSDPTLTINDTPLSSGEKWIIGEGAGVEQFSISKVGATAGRVGFNVLENLTFTVGGGTIFYKASGAAWFEIDGADGTGGYIQSTYSLDFKTYNATDITFKPNNAVAMTLQSGGNVGIGTASPSGDLDINVVTDADAHILISENDATKWDIYNDHNDDALQVKANTTLRYEFSAAGTADADVAWGTFSPAVKGEGNELLDIALEDANKPVKPYEGIPTVKTDDELFDMIPTEYEEEVNKLDENGNPILDEFGKPVKERVIKIKDVKTFRERRPNEFKTQEEVDVEYEKYHKVPAKIAIANAKYLEHLTEVIDEMQKKIDELEAKKSGRR